MSDVSQSLCLLKKCYVLSMFVFVSIVGPDMDCSTIEIAEGETLDSKCPVLGNPVPYVEWHKNGQKINSSMPLRRKDAGTYKVDAEGFSHIKKDVLVRVLCKLMICVHLHVLPGVKNSDGVYEPICL